MRPPVPPSLTLPPLRRRATGFCLSLLVHALLVALALSDVGRRWVLTRPLGDPHLLRRGGGGGGGGGARVGTGDGGRAHDLTYIMLPAASPTAPPASTRPPVRRPVVVPMQSPSPAPQPARAEPVDTASSVASQSGTPSAEASGAGAAVGAGQGIGAGGGTGGGVGAGTGPARGGEGGRGTAPEPRQLVLPPPDSPKDMRGQQIAVTFFVAADGRVMRLAVTPAIRDGGFARKFEEAMRNYRFRPARSPEGTPVPGSTTLTVSF
jgi:hypothetical protein